MITCLLFWSTEPSLSEIKLPATLKGEVNVQRWIGAQVASALSILQVEGDPVVFGRTRFSAVAMCDSNARAVGMGKKGFFPAVDSLVPWAALACLVRKPQPVKEELACCCQLFLLEGKGKPFHRNRSFCCAWPARCSKAPLLSWCLSGAAVRCPTSFFGWPNIDILSLVLCSLWLLMQGRVGEL